MIISEHHVNTMVHMHRCTESVLGSPVCLFFGQGPTGIVYKLINDVFLFLVEYHLFSVLS